jgi:hypothetical protein
LSGIHSGQNQKIVNEQIGFGVSGVSPAIGKLIWCDPVSICELSLRFLFLPFHGQSQLQQWQLMATIDQADIRGSKPHNHDPSVAAYDYSRESGLACRKFPPRILLRACSSCR